MLRPALAARPPFRGAPVRADPGRHRDQRHRRAGNRHSKGRRGGRLRRRRQRPLFLIDIAVPRDGPRCREVPGCSCTTSTTSSPSRRPTCASATRRRRRREPGELEVHEFLVWRIPRGGPPPCRAAPARRRDPEGRGREGEEAAGGTITPEQEQALEAATTAIRQQAPAPAHRPHQGDREQRPRQRAHGPDTQTAGL